MEKKVLKHGLRLAFAALLMTQLLGCGPVKFSKATQSNATPTNSDIIDGDICIRECSPPYPDPSIDYTELPPFGVPSHALDSCTQGDPAYYVGDIATPAYLNRPIGIRAKENGAQNYRWEIYEVAGLTFPSLRSVLHDCYNPPNPVPAVYVKVAEFNTTSPFLPGDYRVTKPYIQANNYTFTLVKLTVTKNGYRSGRGAIYLGDWRGY